MSQGSDAAPQGRTKSRRLLPVVLTGVVLLIGVAILLKYLLRPSQGVVFSVNARTSVLTMTLPCGQDLVWDLPPGELVGRSADPEFPDIRNGAATVTLYGGAEARLVLLPEGRVSMTFGSGEEHSCETGSAQRLRFSVAGDDVDPDPAGYVYKSGDLVGGAEQATFALQLMGHIILGESLQFGAGWSGATPLLQSGVYRARPVGDSSGEQDTYIEGSLDAGTVVDTLPGGRDGEAGAHATGFVLIRPAGMEAQVYKLHEIGVISYAGLPLTFSVPHWRVVVRSASAQVGLTLATALVGILGLTLSWLEALPGNSFSRKIKDRFEGGRSPCERNLEN